MGPSKVSMAARVAGKMRWPKASPQPVTPPSVSTRTSSMSMLVRARPPSMGVAPSMTIGRLRTMVSTRVIFMCNVPPWARPLRARQYRARRGSLPICR